MGGGAECHLQKLFMLGICEIIWNSFAFFEPGFTCCGKIYCIIPFLLRYWIQNSFLKNHIFLLLIIIILFFILHHQCMWYLAGFWLQKKVSVELNLEVVSLNKSPSSHRLPVCTSYTSTSTQSKQCLEEAKPLDRESLWGLGSTWGIQPHVDQKSCKP